MLTSEEPGLWWSDMKNSIICRDSLEALRRTVLRDRNRLVDKDRNPTSILEVFSREFAQINEKPPVEYRMKPCALALASGEYMPLDLAPLANAKKQDENWENALNLLRAPIERFYYQFKRERKAVYGPQLYEDVYALGQLPVKLERRPLVILAGDCLEIPAGKKAALVHFIGNVSLPKGYPAGGAYGEEIGSYT